MGLLSGKKALIVGVASKHSIAYAIAEAFHREGAELAFTYQGDKLGDRVKKMAAEWNSDLCFPCDVSSDEDIQGVFDSLKQQWDGIDILIHSVGFAPAEELNGDYLDITSREGFRIAHDISSYSFVALAKHAKPMMEGRNGAMLTLTYHGSQQTLPNYNVMGLAKASLEASVRYLAGSTGPDGIRVNSISAGPIKTLAASGIKSFRKMLKKNAERAPLKRNITAAEVANTAVFLCSDMASGVTAQNIYVDGGFNTCAMSLEEMED
ncbi:MAG: enoyl-[acyl-carrier-protein] reductase FabI [Oceanospirillaceae bacterium]|uniref:enoyl-ACP reductase FabI n=1 Tax=unclassified Thalassolituus TaxID=2624967 RepID=UPI000C0E71C4|nr:MULTISPECIES: enoyl-ACP reductase [unclassified Thalassolituus]MAE35419.1 enoyl-[acyl-carrier-protein] reductase FabI [Oceanospirillaceae bacterium]MBN58372.1 enoyl-[acyl-carrier-protein] reductase FabI [Oceanospirillaceae bacterium]MDQ4424404.1 enoyl-ACP reductase [Thalassolituus sp.]MDQ4427059.1 enoyl-ACP reductase [Thalassolituus sp.]